MEGQVPNRDFVSLQPPLSFYVGAAIFKLFGTSLVSLRIWGLSIHVLIPLLIYVVSRNFMNCLLSMAAALPAVIMGMPYYGFVPLAVWQGITASLVPSALYIPAALTQRRWLAFCAGIVAALSVFLRHDQGLYLCVSIAVLTVALRYAADSRIAKSELKTIFGVWLAGAGIVATALVIFWHEEKIAGNVQAIGRFPDEDLREDKRTPVSNVQCPMPARPKHDDASLLCSAGTGRTRRRLDHWANHASTIFPTGGVLGGVVGAFLLPGADAVRPGSFINRAAAIFHLVDIRLGNFRGGLLREEIRENI